MRLRNVHALLVRAEGSRRARHALAVLALVVSAVAVSFGSPATPASAAEPTPAVGDLSNLGLGISSPAAIASGADGALWFANRGNDSIGRITVSGELSNFPTSGTDGLREIALGPDGNLWFTSQENDLIGRITPAGEATTFDVELLYPADGVYEIAAGPDGNLWFTGLYDAVGRITPSGVVTRFSSPDISSNSIGITAGSDGNMWFTVGNGRIGRVTSAGVITTFTSDVVKSPQHIALGSDGNLWFTNRSAATIGRITPAGAITGFPLPTASGADTITPGPDGTLWYSNNGDQTLGRVSTTGAVEIVANVSFDWVSGLTTGSDGNVWVANSSDHTISKVTPSGDVTTYRDSISSPIDLISDEDGNLWIANQETGIVRRSADGTMTRFDDPALSRPRSLAIGPDGNLWVATDGTIVRMNPAGVTTTFTHPDVRYLYAITAGPDGNLWFTYLDGQTFTQGGIGTITTEGAVTLHPIGTHSLPSSITTGPDGNLWFTDAHHSVGRITTAGTVTRYTDSSVVSSPGGIVAGPDGNLWFANSGGGKIGRITPGGVITGFPAALGTLALAVGPDGNIWYTSHCVNVWSCPKGGSIGVMTTTGVSADFTAAGVDLPVAIAPGPDGDLFFANMENSSIGRVLAFGRPTPPFTVEATAGPSSITISWSPPASDGGSPITAYTVVGSDDDLTCTRTVLPLSCTFSGLTRDRDHQFQVYATNEHGDGPPASTGPVRPQSTPSPPEDLNARAGNGFALLRWEHPGDDGGLPITGYSITPIHDGQPDPPILLGSDVTTTIVDDLTNGVAYEFHVAALNALGSSPEAASDVVTPSSAEGVLFRPLEPNRILDSRPGPGQVGDYSTPWETTARSMTVAGRGGVPNGADAVVLNVTAVNPTAASYLTILPEGAARPTTTPSSLNYVPGAVVANQVTVPLGPTGRLTVENDAGSVDLVIDVAGYYQEGHGAGFLPVVPSRIADTRPAFNVGQHDTPLGTATRSVAIARWGGIPSDADAVVLNVTVVNPTAPSYLTVAPTGSPTPIASNLNYGRGDTVANQVTVPLGPDGRVNLTNAVGTVDVVIDAVGFFEDELWYPGYSLHPVLPSRILDSRGGSLNVGDFATPWNGSSRDVIVSGRGGIPLGARAFVGNLTVVNATESSYLTLRPGGDSPTTTSSINFDRAEVVANQVTAAPGTSGSVTVTNADGTVDVILDVSGWYG